MTQAFIAFFGVAALVFAALVLTLRQPMRAALALVAHMICLAAIYVCLGVNVVALFQVLIYVGAVMVFMVYTIMLLDDRDTSYRQPHADWLTPSVVAVVLVVSMGVLVFGHETTDAARAAAAARLPDPAGAAAPPFAFTEFSVAFMKHYWFHFELATVLLLVGIVAAWTAVREAR